MNSLTDEYSSDAVQAVDTFTYSYFRLAPARHTVRLVLTHFVHPTDPWLLVQVTTKATSLVILVSKLESMVIQW